MLYDLWMSIKNSRVKNTTKQAGVGIAGAITGFCLILLLHTLFYIVLILLGYVDHDNPIGVPEPMIWSMIIFSPVGLYFGYRTGKTIAKDEAEESNYLNQLRKLVKM
jgi:hypothetical protein